MKYAPQALKWCFMATSMQDHKTLSLNDKVSQEGIYTLHHAWSDTSFCLTSPHPQISVELGSKERPGGPQGSERRMSCLAFWTSASRGSGPGVGVGGRCPFCNLLTVFFFSSALWFRNNLLSHHWLSGQVLSMAQDKKKQNQTQVSPT